ncbi:hypothetical protein CALVIDRAFT_488334 [Calocera viscosa TUFC12733]|uniref:Uncharacterized protein n=1 Tax=Calocera viscosa (strain TUFC12733) TaxID=1330018 RepID=A0A167HSM4_CALVF|nr:hypothetical protein CALVIDRAFT_488334 [Calocera viscosa TUFC12733]
MKEATTLNVQVHLEEFKKQLNQEVLRMTQDVGHLRDEKMKLEQAIAELFAIKAKHGDHVSCRLPSAPNYAELPLKLYHLQQATQQAPHSNQQPQSRQPQKPMPPPPVQQYLHPQQVPGMMYNMPGPYPSGHHPQPQQPQQPRYPAAPPAGRLQMPAPLGGQQPTRQGTHASRPLPTAGGRAAAGGPRAAR